MKRGAAALNRLLVLVVGLLLAGVGGAALAWDRNVETVREAAARIDRDRVAAVPDQSWWQGALVTTIAVAFTLGILVLAVDLARRRAAPSMMLETATDTAVAVDLGPVASGVAAELRRFPGVRRTRGRAVSDRGLATVQVVVDADPQCDIDALVRDAERIAATTTSALGGTAVSDVAVRVLLHLDRADHTPAPTPDASTGSRDAGDRPPE